MIRDALRRARLVLARVGRPTLAALVVLGLLAVGVGAWNYANPPTATVTDVDEQGTVRSELSTSATVTGNTSLFENGTRLRDRSGYMTDSMPRVQLTRETTVPADRQVTVTHELVLVYRLVRDGEAFWTEKRVLASERVTTTNGSAATSTVLDVRAVRARLSEIRQAAGSGASANARVRTRTTYEAEGMAGTLNDTAGVSIGDDWYSVGTPSSERTHQSETERVIEAGHRSSLPYAGPAVLGITLLSLAGAAVLNRRTAVADLERRIHRGRYAEWISEGSLPAAPDEDAVVVDSLEGVVDVAIDTKKRVLHDRDLGWYVVIDGDTWYCYPDGDDAVEPGTGGEDPVWDPAGGETNADGERPGRPVARYHPTESSDGSRSDAPGHTDAVTDREGGPGRPDVAEQSRGPPGTGAVVAAGDSADADAVAGAGGEGPDPDAAVEGESDEARDDADGWIPLDSLSTGESARAAETDGGESRPATGPGDRRGSPDGSAFERIEDAADPRDAGSDRWFDDVGGDPWDDGGDPWSDDPEQ